MSAAEEAPHCGEDFAKSEGLALEDVINDVAHCSCVCETAISRQGIQEHLKFLSCVSVDVHEFLDHQPVENLKKFFSRIVRKVDVCAESAVETWVAIDELFHFFGVTGNDYGEVVCVCFHKWKKRGDCFMAVVILMWAEQAVCLIDKEHAAERICIVPAFGVQFDRRIARLVPRVVGFNKMSAGHETKVFIEICYQSGNSGFPRAGVAGEKLGADQVVFEVGLVLASRHLVGEFG